MFDSHYPSPFSLYKKSNGGLVRFIDTLFEVLYKRLFVGIASSHLNSWNFIAMSLVVKFLLTNHSLFSFFKNQCFNEAPDQFRILTFISIYIH